MSFSELPEKLWERGHNSALEEDCVAISLGDGPVFSLRDIKMRRNKLEILKRYQSLD